jgi:hypothetical protein
VIRTVGKERGRKGLAGAVEDLVNSRKELATHRATAQACGRSGGFRPAPLHRAQAQSPEPAFENLPTCRAPPARLRMSPGTAPLWIGQLSGIEGLPERVFGAKALNPKGLGRHHPTRFC